MRETFEMQIKMETDVNGTGMTRRILGSEFNKFIRLLCLFDGCMEIRRIFSMYAVLFIISSRGFSLFIHLKLGFMTSQTSKQESQCPVSASEPPQHPWPSFHSSVLVFRPQLGPPIPVFMLLRTNNSCFNYIKFNGK